MQQSVDEWDDDLSEEELPWVNPDRLLLRHLKVPPSSRFIHSAVQTEDITFDSLTEWVSQ